MSLLLFRNRGPAPPVVLSNETHFRDTQFGGAGHETTQTLSDAGPGLRDDRWGGIEGDTTSTTLAGSSHNPRDTHWGGSG